MEVSSPIFVVGMPRSGTTLLTAFLSSHSAIASGPETHYYNKFVNQIAKKKTLFTDKCWPHLAVNELADLHLSSRGLIELFDLDKAQLLQYLRNCEPSHMALLNAIMQSQLKKQNKIRWLEKTPNHLLHLDEIRRDFPNAKVIQVIRDHRDIANSMKILPWAYQSSVANATIIEHWHKVSSSFFDSDNACMTVRFEELLESPSDILKRICEFINEAYEPEMLARKSASILADFQDEPWKKEVSYSVDTAKAFKWKRDIQVQDAQKYQCIDNICSSYLNDFSYESSTSLASTGGDYTKLGDCYLLSARDIKFDGLDNYAERLNKVNICISRVSSSNNVLLVLQGIMFIDSKLLIKAMLCKMRSRKKIYYLQKKEDKGIIAFIAKMLFLRI